MLRHLVDDHYDQIRRFGGPALLVVTAGVFIALMMIVRAPPVAERPAATPAPTPVETVEASEPGSFAAQGDQGSAFGFTVPETWDVNQDGSVTRVANPGGRIVVTLEMGSTGPIEEASDRLLDSLLDTQSKQELVGRAWEQIDGTRSLLVSGTADQEGRSVRFLAITIGGEPRNYAITISVPAGSDPERVLPRLERLVSSVQILGSGTEIFAH